MTPGKHPPIKETTESIELKRWRAPPDEPETEPKSFDQKRGKKAQAEEPEPHARPAKHTLKPDEKHDHLAAKRPEAKKDKLRQDALIDEGLEETFPASDPVSVKHIT
jgi:hypothetical protein